MSSNTTAAFGEIQYEESAGGQSSPAGSNSVGDAPVETFDLNDPRLTSEVVDVNPEADAYAQPPTIPAGLYRAKLKALDVKGPDGKPAPCKANKNKHGGLYLFTAVESEVIDLNNPLYDGAKITDNFVDTNVGKMGGSRVSTLLGLLGKPSPAQTTHRTQIDSLRGLLAGEPELGIEVDWEAQCQTCQENAKKKGEYPPRGASLRGMLNFPQVQKKDPTSGKYVLVYNNVVKCPIDPAHGVMYGRPRISRYVPLKELKPGQ